MSGERILVAEDNPGLARVLEFKLQQAGFLVTVCSNGLDAWEALQESEFDALVTDFEMPGLNGEELCRRMRTLPNCAALPAMLVTAREPELDLKRMQEELGLAAVHGKPYSPRQLVQHIAELVQQAASS